MGCIWSSSDADQCRHCSRKAVNNLIVINHQCEVCIRNATRPRAPVQLGVYFGEYKCSCGWRWTSRLSRANQWQKCKQCKKENYPFSQRDLRPSDMSRDKENVKEHPQELCQMCQELGHHCGELKNMNIRKGKNEVYARPKTTKGFLL